MTPETILVVVLGVGAAIAFMWSLITHNMHKQNLVMISLGIAIVIASFTVIPLIAFNQYLEMGSIALAIYLPCLIPGGLLLPDIVADIRKLNEARKQRLQASCLAASKRLEQQLKVCEAKV